MNAIRLTLPVSGQALGTTPPVPLAPTRSKEGTIHPRSEVGPKRWGSSHRAHDGCGGGDPDLMKPACEGDRRVGPLGADSSLPPASDGDHGSIVDMLHVRRGYPIGVLGAVTSNRRRSVGGEWEAGTSKRSRPNLSEPNAIGTTAPNPPTMSTVARVEVALLVPTWWINDPWAGGGGGAATAEQKPEGRKHRKNQYFWRGKSRARGDREDSVVQGRHGKVDQYISDGDKKR